MDKQKYDGIEDAVRYKYVCIIVILVYVCMFRLSIYLCRFGLWGRDAIRRTSAYDPVTMPLPAHLAQLRAGNSLNHAGHGPESSIISMLSKRGVKAPTTSSASPRLRTGSSSNSSNNKSSSAPIKKKPRLDLVTSHASVALASTTGDMTQEWSQQDLVGGISTSPAPPMDIMDYGSVDPLVGSSEPISLDTLDTLEMDHLMSTSDSLWDNQCL